MHARSLTIVGRPDRIDEAIAFVRDDALPTVTSLEGNVGLSMLVERETGRTITTTSWLSESAMAESDAQLAPLRTRGTDILAGEMTIDQWEVAVMHRDHTAREGAACRVTWLRLNHSDPDRGIGLYSNSMLPDFETIDGFCSASLMINRQKGRACSTTTYDTLESMAASRDRSWALRESAVREAGVDVMDVSEFELVLAHLRVPELV